MTTIATVSFLLWSLAAVVLAFMLVALAMGAVAAFRNVLSLGFLLFAKLVMVIASAAFGLSALLNIAVFLIHIAKAA